LDALVQELLQIEGEAGDLGRARAELRADGDRVRARLELDHHLAPLGPEGVLGERRAADHLRDRADAGDGEERARRRGPDARGLVQPDAGRPGVTVSATTSEASVAST